MPGRSARTRLKTTNPESRFKVRPFFSIWIFLPNVRRHVVPVGQARSCQIYVRIRFI